MHEIVEIFKDKTNFTSDEFLHINSCGVSKYDNKAHIYRPNGRVDLHILFHLKGSITISCGEEYSLSPGEAFILFENEPQDYTFSPTKEEPEAETLWIHFCGTAARQMLKTAGIDHSAALYPVSPAETERLFRQLIRYHLAGDSLMALSYLIRMVSSMSPDKKRPLTESERAVRREAERIASNFTQEADLDAAATRCNLSRTRFSHLFKEVIGISPLRMQTNMRLDHARDLLLYTELSVKEVAESCGYADQLYFSRIFKESTGISPSEYKKYKDL